ncbi:MAG: hypothetical protein Q4D81_07305, partial [Eubacteriales bacterium]|nr:hypothetical protein [Eubacteriales bacterium]
EPKADKKEASAIDKESGKSAERESGKTGGKDTEGTDKLLSDESKVKTMPASTDTLEKVKGTDSAAGKTDPVQAAKKEAEAYVAAARENAQAGASAAGAKGQGTGAASSGGRSTAGGSSGIGKSASGGSSGGGSHGGSGSGQGFSGSNDSPSSLYDDAVSVSSPVDETPASGLSAGADAAGTDAVSEYLSSLLSGQKEMTNELSEWTKTNLRNWGRKAAQKLSSASATFTSPNPVKTVAESVVRAAVVDVGIELAAHGAGAVSAISGGKKDIFEELNEKEEDAVPG